MFESCENLKVANKPDLATTVKQHINLNTMFLNQKEVTIVTF